MNMFKISFSKVADAQWLAEVLGHPRLRAVAPDAISAIRKTQVILLRSIADQLESHQLAPVEFSIVVAQNTMTPEIAVHNLLERLSAASMSFELAKADRDKRVAATSSIAALSLFLIEMAGMLNYAKPLKHLSMALADLDHGTVNPILKPRMRPQNKPIDSTRLWEIKACLAAALELRLRLGDRVEDGATRVVRDAKKCGIAFSKDRRRGGSDTTRIIQLRKDFRRHGGTGPRDGYHRTVWSAFLERVETVSQAAGSARSEELEELYISALAKAAQD